MLLLYKPIDSYLNTSRICISVQFGLPWRAIIHNFIRPHSFKRGLIRSTPSLTPTTWLVDWLTQEGWKATINLGCIWTFIHDIFWQFINFLFSIVYLMFKLSLILWFINHILLVDSILIFSEDKGYQFNWSLLSSPGELYHYCLPLSFTLFFILIPSPVHASLVILISSSV